MKKELKKEIQFLIDIYELNCSIDEFENKVNWYSISRCQKLSEPFIEKFYKKVDWYSISRCQKLSEPFIENFKDYVNWHSISSYQKLSEDFIENHKNLINWNYISVYQKLNENFIERNKNLVNWDQISIYQQLSENFIERNKNLVNWDEISIYQQLSEAFIKKFKDYVNWNLIPIYQHLSPSFRKKFDLEIPENNTMYMTKKEISNLIPDCYQREGDYVIAYKNIRQDRYSQFNFQYMYEKGGIYKSHCDCNNDKENSFGLSLWTYKEAKNFRKNGIVVKCRVNVEDIGAVVHSGNKLRCKRIEVLE